MTGDMPDLKLLIGRVASGHRLTMAEAEKKVSELPAGSVDLFWTAQNYHDLKNLPNADTVAFDKAVFGILKPGGVYLVIDHSAPAGSGVSDICTRK